MFKHSLFGYDKEQVDEKVKELLGGLEKKEQQEHIKLEQVKQEQQHLIMVLNFLKDQCAAVKRREVVNSKLKSNLHGIIKNLRKESGTRAEQIKAEIAEYVRQAAIRIQEIEEEKNNVIKTLQNSFQEVGSLYKTIEASRSSSEIKEPQPQRIMQKETVAQEAVYQEPTSQAGDVYQEVHAEDAAYEEAATQSITQLDAQLKEAILSITTTREEITRQPQDKEYTMLLNEAVPEVAASQESILEEEASEEDLNDLYPILSLKDIAI